MIKERFSYCGPANAGGFSPYLSEFKKRMLWVIRTRKVRGRSLTRRELMLGIPTMVILLGMNGPFTGAIIQT